ncbi:MAG: hypothetical protein ABR570_05770 [Burkholderiales bacterium]
MFNAMPGRPRSKKQPQEPVFASPPLWIHASAAAKCFLGKESPLLISRRREAKRRALLQMLDRLPIRTEGRAVRPIAVKAVAPAEVPLARPTTGAAHPRAQK